VRQPPGDLADGAPDGRRVRHRPDPRAGLAPDARRHVAGRSRPTLESLAGELIPRALGRVLSGDRGDPQTDDGASYAGSFEEDYALLDPGRPRAELERQVRAWAWMFGSPVVGPVAEVDGRRVRVLAASLDDPLEDAVVRLDAPDGPLWLTAIEDTE
jgi:methionyl-tRNA formyltransferase